MQTNNNKSITSLPSPYIQPKKNSFLENIKMQI